MAKAKLYLRMETFTKDNLRVVSDTVQDFVSSHQLGQFTKVNGVKISRWE